MKRILALALLLCLALGLSAQSTARKAFLPGISASLVNLFGNGKLYPGLNLHYSFIQGITHPKDSWDFGGYYEWYGEIGFFKELNSSMTEDIFFIYDSGWNLSFEKFVDGPRNFLVPYFGAKLGGVYFNTGKGGFFIEPILGMVILESRSVVINYDCGLFLNTADLSGRIGLHNSLIVNFNL